MKLLVIFIYDKVLGMVKINIIYSFYLELKEKRYFIQLFVKIKIFFIFYLRLWGFYLYIFWGFVDFRIECVKKEVYSRVLGVFLFGIMIKGQVDVEELVKEI